MISPEDPYPVFSHASGEVLIAPLFLLYDYSFRREPSVPVPLSIGRDGRENMCADEYFLRPDPFPDRTAWCAERCAAAAERLARHPASLPKVLVNHYPLEERLAVLPRAPRFTPWCGTRRTRGWHTRFNACAVVYGHLHIRGTHWIDSVPFQEVSLGYPTQWDQARGIAGYLREVLVALSARGGLNVGEIEAVRVCHVALSEHEGCVAARRDAPDSVSGRPGAAGECAISATPCSPPLPPLCYARLARDESPSTQLARTRGRLDATGRRHSGRGPPEKRDGSRVGGIPTRRRDLLVPNTWPGWSACAGCCIRREPGKPEFGVRISEAVAKSDLKKMYTQVVLEFTEANGFSPLNSSESIFCRR